MKTDTAISAIWRRQRLFGVGLICIFVLLYLIPLGNRPLAIPDETRYASVPYEMLVGGDWITPHLNGLRYFEKPPLGYWLNALSIEQFGENNFAVRLASAIAAGLTSFLAYLMSMVVTSGRRTALLAALIYMTFVEVYMLGTYSVLDGVLALFLTSGLVSFFLGVREHYKTSRNRTTEWFSWAASGILLGFAFLTKGFLAFAVPVLVLVPWLVWNRQWKILLVKSWIVVLVAIVVILPWAIQIHLREGDFWNYFIWIEHVKRFVSEDAQHKEPFYYFVFYLPIVAFPWLSLLPAAFLGLRQNESVKNTGPSPTSSAAQRFLWIWMVVPFLFFSASNGKLITYILPCFAPLAILLAIGLTRYLKQHNDNVFYWGIWVNIALLILVLMLFVGSQAVDFGFSIYRGNEAAKAALIVICLLTAILCGAYACTENSIEFRLLMVGAMILPVVAFMHYSTPAMANESKSPETLFKQVKHKVDRNTIVISDSAMLRGVNWYLKRNDVYVIEPGEVGYGLGYPDSRHRHLTPTKFEAIVKRAGVQAIILFCRKGCPDAIMKEIPPNSKIYAYGKFSAWLIQ